MRRVEVQPIPKLRYSRASKIRRDSAELAKIRPLLMERSLGRCEAQFSEHCTGVGVMAHHKQLRSSGGNNHPANLVWLCAPCHDAVHGHPLAAAERGLIVRSR